jgi:type II secretory pathway component PulF
MSVKDQTFFVKRLAFLIKANVSILEGLYMVRDQTRRGGHVRIIERVIEDVSNGQTLSRSMGKFPTVFGDFGVNLIKVGESSGTLSQNLEYLADELRKRYALKKKITGALVYPAVIGVATIGITAFLMLYLFPKIMPIFASLHTELPFSTRVVIAISTFLQHSWWAVLIGMAGFVVVFIVLLRKSSWFRYTCDRALLSIPVVGRMARDYNLANLSRTLGLLLKSGLTLSDALPLTADTTKNKVYKDAINALAEGVTRGERMSIHLKKNRTLFPDVMSQMVSVGEHSGNLSNTLVYLSELYDAEVEEFTKNISTLVEPVMMVVMGIIVGFIAISIITPIYGITQNISAIK